MTSFRVYALSTDSEWLKAVASVSNASTVTHCVSHQDDLPQPHPMALLLLDVASQPDVAGLVHDLRERGWPYIVVVSAAPSWKEARAVLQAGAYDYIAKSNTPSTIHRVIEKYLDEIVPPDEKGSDSDPDEGFLFPHREVMYEKTQDPHS